MSISGGFSLTGGGGLGWAGCGVHIEETTGCGRLALSAFTADRYLIRKLPVESSLILSLGMGRMLGLGAGNLEAVAIAIADLNCVLLPDGVTIAGDLTMPRDLTFLGGPRAGFDFLCPCIDFDFDLLLRTTLSPLPVFFLDLFDLEW